MSIHYEFPVIRNIDDVLPHIHGRDEFIVAHKDGYSVVNYVMMGNGTFPAITTKPLFNDTPSVLRECRGLIFDAETGALVSRPYHKFFNHGEREDNVPDVARSHVWLEKLDGSMVRPFSVSAWNGAIRWGTKMGITDTAMRAEAFVAAAPHYTHFADRMIGLGQTPIFEWLSAADRIVVEYPDDSLVLTAIRDNLTGKYMDHKALGVYGRHFDIPVVQVKPLGTILNPTLGTACEHKARTEEGHEGYVIRFYDGHMVKLKNEWYTKLHRAKSFTSRERYVVALILDEKTDDVMPLLPEADKVKLRTYITEFWSSLKNVTKAIVRFQRIANIEGRKEFALKSKVDQPLKSLVFRALDGVDPMTAIRTVIAKNLSNEKSFARVKWMFPSAKWTDVEV